MAGKRMQKSGFLYDIHIYSQALSRQKIYRPLFLVGRPVSTLFLVLFFLKKQQEHFFQRQI